MGLGKVPIAGLISAHKAPFRQESQLLRTLLQGIRLHYSLLLLNLK